MNYELWDLLTLLIIHVEILYANLIMTCTAVIGLVLSGTWRELWPFPA